MHPLSRSTSIVDAPARTARPRTMLRSTSLATRSGASLVTAARPPLRAFAMRARTRKLVVKASRNSTPEIADRVVAAIPYLLPFLDAFSYGRFLFYAYPQITRAISPMAPLINLYASVPFAPLICFFGIYLGVVNNTSWRRFVRFNAMQAVLLDILLILPRLVESLISPPTAGWGLQAYISAQNTVWLFVAACVLYGIGASLLGATARIPFVADAADQQVR